MGAKKRQREAFLIKHPNCYFCTGAAETEDHVPSRECFIDRIWPDGYSFPACKRCNSMAAGIEQAIALYRHGADFSLDERSRPQLFKLYQGVRNNRPDLLPILIGANQKRRAAKKFNLEPEPGGTYADLPIVKLPDAFGPAITLFCRRLTCALFYQHIGKPLPLKNSILTVHLPFRDNNVEAVIGQFSKYAQHATKTNRQNTDIGDQFMYLWRADSDEDFFLFTAQIAKSFFVVGATAQPNAETTKPGWKLHSDDWKL